MYFHVTNMNYTVSSISKMQNSPFPFFMLYMYANVFMLIFLFLEKQEEHLLRRK